MSPALLSAEPSSRLESTSFGRPARSRAKLTMHSIACSWTTTLALGSSSPLQVTSGAESLLSAGRLPASAIVRRTEPL
jgi:hypothetical protein